MTSDSEQNEVERELLEKARRIYRALEMSAGIMRDPKRTGGWEGAERTASAFERQGIAAKELHDELALALTQLAKQREEVERLNERLENNHVFNAKGKRKEVAPGSIPDGIECRDETIRQRDASNASLQERIAGLEEGQQAAMRHVFAGALKYAFGYDVHTSDRLTLEQRENTVARLIAEARALTEKA